MAVSNELLKPETEDDFEAMCHQLYKSMWHDVSCVRYGRGGQGQSGVDILGRYHGKNVGVQCKHYNKKPFVMSTITGDIKKAEAGGLAIDHLLFATTAGSDPSLIKLVQELSEKRREEGKFTISVDFWGDICGHLRIHSDVGRAFIQNFPGAVALETRDTSFEILSVAQHLRVATETQHSTILGVAQETNSNVLALSKQLLSPEAKGDEADPAVVAKLDLVRDRLQEGKTKDATKILSELGDPQNFRDQFSKFRWYTNWSSIELEEGRSKAAAEGYLQAFAFAKENEKAAANRAHAFLLLGDPETALAACDEGLNLFQESTHLWAIRIHALQLLGSEDPELSIPMTIRDSHELLFSRARLASREKNYPKAIELLEKCLDSDGGSFDAKRSLLVEALEWASQDPVRAINAHLSSETRNALLNAVHRLEPLEQTLSWIQSDATSEEVACNTTSALFLLGERGRAQGLASIFLPRHPHAEALLRIRILGLAQDKDFLSIRKITDDAIDELPIPVLALLAEVSANHGDVLWHECVQNSIEKREKDQSRIADIGVLRFQAQWVSGDKTGAIDGVQGYVKENPTHVMAHLLLAKFLAQEGRHDDAMRHAMACLELVKNKDSIFDNVQLAEVLFSLRDFDTAATIYETVVTDPGADELTFNLLICLVETDQRQKALEILERMSPPDRRDSRILRIECNLAGRMSDWKRLRELLSLELARLPGSAEIAVAYVVALYRGGELEARRAYLESDPTFKESSAENEFEFAKHQSEAGLLVQALKRLYRLYKSNPNSTKIAGFYLSQLLLAPITNELDASEEVSVGSAVKLRSDASSWWALIDEVGASGSWPELVASESAVASQLIGRRVGEFVTVARGLSVQQAEIVEVKSQFVFAAEKAHERLAASVAQEGPLWSFNAYREDGELDIETISNSVGQRRKRVEAAFDSYEKYRFPICFLASLIGTDPVALLLDWPFAEHKLFVGLGSHEERESAIELIESEKRRYVLDLTAIAELTRHDLFDVAAQVIGAPLVPQSARDEVMNSLQMHKGRKPTATLSERHGKLSMVEVDQRIYEERIDFYERVIANIDKCDVCPTIGPRTVDDSSRKLASILDNHAVDSLYLCVERNAVLIAEDGGLRQVASGFGVSDVAWMQPLMMVAHKKGHISLHRYANAMSTKIMLGHEFVSVSKDDLMHVAKSQPSKVSKRVNAMLDTCRRPTVDLKSAVEVTIGFLQFSAAKLPVRVTAGYSRYVRDVLCDGRPDLCEIISDRISIALQAVYGRNGRRVKIDDRKHFDGLLKRVIRVAS